MVVVLDDLHWADLASLQLLTHLADGIAASRLLLVASRRLHESGSLSATLSETLAALARAETLRIELCGLDSEEAQALVAAAAGQHISAQTATRLWARTEGNPFFLREMVELLLSEQRLDEQRLDELEPIPVPGPVREVVLRRVGRLPEAAAALLSVAAAAGRHFDVEVVAEAASVEIEVALEAIDAAVAAGLVVENEHRLGWFRFTHADAAESWRQALAAADLAGDEVDRYPLLINLAASLYRAGKLQDGFPVFVQAMEQALEADEPARLVSAALGTRGESNWYPAGYGVVDQRLINILERALPRLTDPAQRALVLSCLAVARYYDNNPPRRAALSDEALGLAALPTTTSAWHTYCGCGRWRCAPPTTSRSAWKRPPSCWACLAYRRRWWPAPGCCAPTRS